MHRDRGEKTYCFDGESFAEGQMPKHVKEFFEPPVKKPQQQSGNAGPEGPAPIGSDSPAPSILKKGGSGGSGGKEQGGIDWDMGKKMAAAGAASDSAIGGGSVSSRPVEEAPALSIEKFHEIQIGMDRRTVMAKLGKPHGAVMNVSVDGIVQILNYVTTEGTAAVHLLEGKVVTIRRPRS